MLSQNSLAKNITKNIRAYYGDIASDEHHRYRSWEHCYKFFHDIPPNEVQNHRKTAALQLGFYLASWGMYRGSSFLLKHAYTVHLEIIDCLVSTQLLPLWQNEFGSSESDSALIPTVLNAVQAIRAIYKKFGSPTDTLVTKVLLGTLGCLPACDRFFLCGFKSEGLAYSCVNAQFVERILIFCRTNAVALRSEQARIMDSNGVHYPFMKLVDMYFWQLGYDHSL